MPGLRHYTYEAMFLLPQSAASDFAGAIAHLNEVLARGKCEVLAMRKWDERRLAYEVKGQKRGIYILTYFKAPNDMLSHIERDCNLSETILRTLILRADHLTPEEIQAADARKELEVEARMRASQAAQPAGAQGGGQGGGQGGQGGGQQTPPPAPGIEPVPAEASIDA